LWRRLLPWVVALGALAWLGRTVPLADLREAISHVNLVAFLAEMVVFVVGTLLLDTLATWATFRYSLADVNLSFRDALVVRGASYLLAILHYGAGQGGLAYFVHRKHHVELARAAGAVMLIMGVNVVVVALCAFAGTLAGEAPDTPLLRWLVIGIGCGFPGYIAVILLKPAFLAKRKLLAPLFTAGIRGHAFAALARLPHIAWLVTMTWVIMRLYGVEVPFLRAVTLLPIVFAVAVLPISPSGLGTTQALSVAMFARYAYGPNPDAAVLAYSLAVQFGSLLVQLPIGLLFLRGATRADIVDGNHGAART
jgi:uncharacterized membrane protein YbhN (UPF0104 family)